MNKSALALLTALMIFAQLVPMAGAITGSRSAADVTVTEITTQPTPLFNRSNITITVIAKNLGTENATNITVHLEAWNNTLSKPIDLGNDTSLGHDNGGTNLTFNSTAQVVFHWNTSKVGMTIKAGLVYTLNATAKNKTDGSAANAVKRINITFLDEAYLVITQATPTATKVDVGADFNITYKVQNIGSKAQDALGDNLEVYMDDGVIPLESVQIQGLTPGKVAQGMFILDTSTYTPGNHSFTLHLLYAGRNATVQNISFLAPNPYISKLEWWPAGGKVGDTVQVNATVSNNGTSDIIGLTVHFFIDPPYVLSYLDTTVNVTAGGTNMTVLKWNTTGFGIGNHTVRASLGSEWPSEITTSNITLDAGGMADLAIASLTIKPSAAEIGRTVNISATVMNEGTWPSLPTNLSFTAIKGLESKEIGLQPLDALAPSASAVVSLLWNTTGQAPWNYNIWVRVDPFNEQPDMNANNNRQNMTLTLTGKTDLAVTTFNMTSEGKAVENIHKGDVANLNVVVSNIGVKASDPARVVLFLDGSTTPFANMRLFGVTVGGEQTLPFTWATREVALGNHSFKAVVDPDNNNSESDKANNVKILNITVLEPVGVVDMTVLSVSINPKSPSVGDHVVVTTTVRNIGAAKAINASVQFSYIIQGGNIAIDALVLPSVQSGENVSLDAIWATGNLASGAYTLNITVDPLNQLHELDRSNNFKTLPITLQPKPQAGQPDLKVTSITWDQKKPQDKKNLRITVTVKNVGDRDANNVRVVLYTDGLEVGTYIIPLIKKGGSNATAVFNWTAKIGNHEVKAAAFVGTSSQPDDTTTKFLKAYESNETKFGSYLPLVAIIIVLLIIAIALLAMTRSGKEDAPTEEEDAEAGAEEE